MAKVIRTDQIGSYIRMPALLDARDDYKAGRIDAAQLRAAEDRAIVEMLEIQRAAGVEVYGDGEFRRDAYQTGISQAIDGFSDDYPIREFDLPDGSVRKIEAHAKPVVGKLRGVRRFADTEAAFLKKHAPGIFKVTLTSPACIARRNYIDGVSEKAYPDQDELLADLTAIIGDEMTQLTAEGVPYIQLDQGFADYAREDWLNKAAAKNLDVEKQLMKDVAAENKCYDGARRPDVIFAMHACRGNRTSAVHTHGGYDWLAERLFDKLHVDRFLLEYESDRAGGFEPLRFLPKGKVAVIGIVSSKNPRIEKQDDIRRRVDEAAKFCAVDQLALSAQCGFAGSATRDGQHMSVDQEKRKLEFIADTARKIWT